MQGQPAPPDYYQSNLVRAFTFVLQRYADLLPADHTDSLNQFLAATDDSQRLLARLLTRKGPYFMRSSLGYSEVAVLDQALLELAHKELITSDPGPADSLLQANKKQTLCECFRLPKALRVRPKSAIIEHIIGRNSDAAICTRLLAYKPWVRLKNPEHWQLARFLFFGTASQDWSTFVLKDLGQTRYEVMPLLQRQYIDKRALHIRLIGQKLQRASFRLDEYPLLANALLNELRPLLTAEEGDPRLQRCALRVGNWAEKKQLFDLALIAYGLAGIPPARERSVRILHRQGNHNEVTTIIQRILCHPRSAKERVFAERFGRRGAGFQPETTTLTIDRSFDSVEALALEKLLEQGGWGLHCENALFKSFVGLLYWPVIFADVDGAFTNPFQSAPHDLFDEGFCHRRESSLLEQERLLADDAQLARFLLETLEQKQGIANRLVSWSLFQTIPLDQWLRSMPIGVIRDVAAFLIRNLSDYRSGFPDLFVCYSPGVFEFVEVKGPGDQLQPQQRAWFQMLASLDLPARVLKLRRP